MILHYQISIPSVSQFNKRPVEEPIEDAIVADGVESSEALPPSPVEKQKVSAKQALLNWVNDVLPDDYQVNNFTKDWNDGITIQALVDNIAPGLCPEYQTANPRNALENATLAMERAADCMDVPMVSTETDDLDH